MAWWFMLVIPALKKLRLEDCCKFKVNLGQRIKRLCFNTLHHKAVGMTDKTKHMC